MKVPFLDLRTQYLELKAELDDAVSAALDSGWYILGKRCEAFEEEFAEYLGGGHVACVNSGTDAIKLALVAAGAGPGDEVITVANTAIPTATAICSTGAAPVFADVDPRTWLISPARIEASVTDRTKAIVPVHLYGAACDMDAVMEIAAKRGLAVIEDTAQAAGAVYRGRKCGTIGDYGAFSFYPSKNLGAMGDGGAVFVKTEEQRDALCRLRNYGQSTRYRADVPRGENSRLDEIQAAALSVKLKYLDGWVAKRGELAAKYRAALASCGAGLAVQEFYPGAQAAPHLFVVKTDRHRRDALMEALAADGVQTLVHYPHPLYEQPAFARYKRGTNPVAEELCASVVSLPFHQYLTDEEIDYVAQCLSKHS